MATLVMAVKFLGTSTTTMQATTTTQQQLAATFSVSSTNYTDVGINLSARSCVVFQVSACQYASVALTEFKNNYSSYYVIVLHGTSYMGGTTYIK